MIGMAELRVRQVPEAIYRELKVWSAMDAVTLNALIIEILKAAVDKRRPKK